MGWAHVTVCVDILSGGAVKCRLLGIGDAIVERRRAIGSVERGALNIRDLLNSGTRG